MEIVVKRIAKKKTYTIGHLYILNDKDEMCIRDRSTWHHNEFRANEMMERFWNHFNVETQEHFYQAGGHLENRHACLLYTSRCV